MAPVPKGWCLFSGMKDFAESFYKSKTWQNCRSAYLKSVGGLCEECLRSGIITAAVIVHHKCHITQDNIDNPNVTLNHGNLEALCRDCHGKRHGTERRYKVDTITGNITIL